MKRDYSAWAVNAMIVAALIALAASAIAVSRNEASARRGRELREELSRMEATYLPPPR